MTGRKKQTVKMYERVCKVNGCDRQARTRDCCVAHYNQWYTTGIEPTLPFTIEARFYRFVAKSDPSDCWIWNGQIKKNGYGRFSYQGTPIPAHRASYRISKGDIPEGLVIRHTCDVKRCVNPNHLIVGTPADNARDAVERGLYPRGEDQPRSKLTLRQVVEIRNIALERNESHASIGRKFGISKAQVRRIVVRESWTGLGENA